MAKAQYGILRFAKYKGPEISNIEAHNERTKESYASTPAVYLSRSKFNFHLIEPQDKYRAQAEARIKECQCPRVCSNSVRVVETLITASPEFFEGKKNEEVCAYFEHALGFLQSRIVPENFISAVVHMDEKTPHMHVSFVPITEDGRLSAKEIVGNKKKLTEWQDGFWQHMVEKYPDLERGKSASITGRTHIPPRLFKEAEHLDKQLRSILAIMDETNAFTARKNNEEIRKRLKKIFPKMTKFKETLSGYEKAYRELQKENASLISKMDKLEADKADLSKQVKEKKLTERLTAKQLEADYQNLYRRVSQYAPELLRGVPDPQKKKELSL